LSDLSLSSVPRTGTITLDTLQRLSLWLLIVSGWYVLMEPAPYELLFALCLLLFLPTGLAVPRVTAPFILFVTLYDVGGVISLSQLTSDTKAVTFTVVSVYMSVTAIFFALCVASDPMPRMAVIRNAYIVAGVLAALTGLIGYFDIAGFGPAWAPIQRAQGTFKDPNVLSTFIIPPVIFIVQGFLLGRQKWRPIAALALLVMLSAIFLAFSRGAWINAIGAIALAVGVTFLVAPSAALRVRIILLASIGAFVGLCLLAFLLSFEQVRDLFAERASLLQSYDTGETGRFGNQINSIPLLLDNPFGLAPIRFRYIFGEDPHNVYVNAFAAYGWIGGLSYLLLIISTVAVGFKTIFTRTPWQHYAIATFCPLFAMVLQGIQIDTDHWRHFYLLLGIVWGLYAATVAYRPGLASADPVNRPMPPMSR
jgi:hypothetical protein